MSDAELVGAARDGAGDAFGQLAQRWFDRCWEVALRILHDHGLAADVAQDTLVTAWQRLDRLQDPQAFGGWVLRIARNRALDRLARERRTMPAGDDARLDQPDDVGSGSLPEREVQRQEAHDLVWAAAAALGERDASILDLHLRHGLEPAELAQELDIAPNAAHQALFRLRQRLGDAVRAWLLWHGGEPTCVVLTGELHAAGATSFDRQVARLVLAHAEGCLDCAAERDRCTAPAAMFSAVPLLVAPLALRTAALDAVLAAVGVPHAAGGPGTSGEVADPAPGTQHAASDPAGGGADPGHAVTGDATAGAPGPPPATSPTGLGAPPAASPTSADPGHLAAAAGPASADPGHLAAAAGSVGAAAEGPVADAADGPVVDPAPGDNEQPAMAWPWLLVAGLAVVLLLGAGVWWWFGSVSSGGALVADDAGVAQALDPLEAPAPGPSLATPAPDDGEAGGSALQAPDGTDEAGDVAAGHAAAPPVAPEGSTGEGTAAGGGSSEGGTSGGGTTSPPDEEPQEPDPDDGGSAEDQGPEPDDPPVDDEDPDDPPADDPPEDGEDPVDPTPPTILRFVVDGPGQACEPVRGSPPTYRFVVTWLTELATSAWLDVGDGPMDVPVPDGRMEVCGVVGGAATLVAANDAGSATETRTLG